MDFRVGAIHILPLLSVPHTKSFYYYYEIIKRKGLISPSMCVLFANYVKIIYKT